MDIGVDTVPNLFHEYGQDAVLWSSVECGGVVVIGLTAVNLDRAVAVEPTREREHALNSPWIKSLRDDPRSVSSEVNFYLITYVSSYSKSPGGRHLRNLV
jgi:hypothetical protein